MRVTVDMQLPGDGRPAMAALVRRLGKIVAHLLRHGQWNRFGCNSICSRE